MQSVVSVYNLHLRLCKVKGCFLSVFYEMRYPVTLMLILCILKQPSWKKLLPLSKMDHVMIANNAVEQLLEWSSQRCAFGKSSHTISANEINLKDFYIATWQITNVIPCLLTNCLAYFKTVSRHFWDYCKANITGTTGEVKLLVLMGWMHFGQHFEYIWLRP